MRLSTMIILLALTLLPAWSDAKSNAPDKTCEIERLMFAMIPKTDIDEQAVEYQPLIRLFEQGRHRRAIF